MGGSYKIELANSVADVEKLRPIWSEMVRHPNIDIDFYQTIVNSRNNVLRPRVATLYKDGEAIAIMVSRIEEITIVCKVGYLVLCKIPVTSLTVPEGGFLGSITPLEAQMLFANVLQVLKEGSADVAYFHNMRLGSEMHLCIKRMVGVFARDIITPTAVHWVMDLPGDIEEYRKEMLLRHRRWVPTVRRYQRALTRDFGGNVGFREYCVSGDVEQLCLDAENIAKKTYQRALGVGFQDNQENRQRLGLDAKYGRLRACILYVDSEPASFWIGSVFRNTFYSAFLGFDPALSKYQPGNLVFMNLTEKLCAESIRHVDFGSGDAFYKERFGTTSWEESSMFVFAPRLRCIAINAVHTATRAVDLAGRFVLRHLNVFQRIKTVWRKQLTKSQAGETT